MADLTGEDPLRALVRVMDRLRSPGGCPWDADQTHESLARFCLEEAHEVVEAVETGDRTALREELGDLLLQVVFHARLAQEHPEEPFDLDDVARTLVAKLVRRHPHVFAGVAVSGAGEVHANWESIKAAEKRRASVLDGIPPSLPALARAQKVLSRAARAGIDALAVAGERGGLGRAAPDGGADAASATVGDRLLAAVADAERAGLDAEQELRRVTRRVEAQVRAAEGTGAGPGPRDAGSP